MHPTIRQVAPDFWNIRGSFKIGGLIDVGTQVSLVRKNDGGFVFLDAYSLPEDVEREVRALTHDGKDIEAIVNVHPFHTIHVRRMHERFPRAKLYGTARHVQRFADLPWERKLTESPELHAMFAGDFEFSVPRGVDFISANEHVHFSSVLVFHRSSQTIHVDDTLMYVRLPQVMRLVGLTDLMRFHPTLAKAMQKRAGAARDFRDWAQELAEGWRDAQNLCAAHTAVLIADRRRGPSIHDRIIEALDKVSDTLEAHGRKYG
jgi:hypothetical protein